jgi:hypothetical protein
VGETTIGTIEVSSPEAYVPSRSVVVGLCISAVAATAAHASSPEASRVRDCRPGEVKHGVVAFTRAFNAGDIRKLDGLFARKGHGSPGFQWYSTGPPGARFGSAATNRSTLMSYFAARHRARERLKLLQLSGGNADDNAYADFAFHILRQARGLRATAFEGKGASICSRYGARIAVWAIGPHVSR